MPVDPQTMAMATNYSAYGGADRTRTMTSAGGQTGQQGTRAIPQYEYAPEEQGGRYDGRRRGGGGNSALKTAAWILIPLLIIAAFLGIGYAVLGSGGSSSDTMVTVPDLTNQTKEAAEQALKDRKLKFTYGPAKFDSEVPKNSVISTTPAGGTEVAPDSSVTIVLSKGEEKATIPEDLIGKTPQEAKAELEQMGLKASIMSKQSAKPQGQVFATDPKPGEKVSKDSLVTLYVPKELTEVPSVVGLTLGDAKSTLEGAGFKVRSVMQPSDTVPEANVIDQAPGGGTNQMPGTTITLTVSSGPSEDPTFPEPTDEAPTDQGPTDQGPTDQGPTDDGGDLDLGDGAGDTGDPFQ
jgi:serine/threonine-protein kinase